MKIGETWIRKRDDTKWIIKDLNVHKSKLGLALRLDKLGIQCLWLNSINDVEPSGWIEIEEFRKKFYKDYNESR